VTDNRPEKTQSDINTQLTKTNNDTENERDEPSENVNSDIEIRTIDPYFSFIERPQKTDTPNNRDSKNENKSISEEHNLNIKLYRHTILTQT